MLCSVNSTWLLWLCSILTQICIILFRYIEIFKSCKGDIKYVSSPKLKPLMSTRPGPYDRSAGGFGGGRGRFGGGGNERR